MNLLYSTQINYDRSMIGYVEEPGPDSNYLHSELTSQVIKLFFKVYNKLGSGFLKKVYEHALVIEMKKAGIPFSQQVPINVSMTQQKMGCTLLIY